MSQNLNLLNSEILATVATVAGISRTPSEWSDADKSDMRQCIRRGLRKFYQPQPLPNSTIHQWRFLERKFYMAAETSYSNGVLKIANGTVVMVAIGPVWPSWSLDGIINTGGRVVYVTGVTGVGDGDRTIDNTALSSDSITFDGTIVRATTSGASATITVIGHTVVSTDVSKILQITSGTNFIAGQYTVEAVDTAANTWTLNAVATTGSGSAMAGATGYTFSIYRYRYPLPADFAEFIGSVTYSGAGHTRLLRNTDDKEIRLRYGTTFRTDGYAGHTGMYSIQHGKSSEADVANTSSNADAARWYISFWPTLGTAGSVTSIYRASPPDYLDATDITDVTPDYVQVDPVHAETLMAAILSSVDEIYNDRMDGIYHTLFLTRLEASIAHDRHAQGNQDFGGLYSHDGRFNARRYSLLYHVPTYDTV